VDKGLEVLINKPMVTHNLTFGQRYYLQKMSLWIHNTQIMLWGEDTPIKINGKEKVLSRYYFYVNDILSREGGGWYTNVERDMLNELRERYINDSMDIHYVDGIWI
jgi:hypothetical protein